MNNDSKTSVQGIQERANISTTKVTKYMRLGDSVGSTSGHSARDERMLTWQGGALWGRAPGSSRHPRPTAVAGHPCPPSQPTDHYDPELTLVKNSYKIKKLQLRA